MITIKALLIALAIGMIVSFPIGPLGLLCVRRTINRGWQAGFKSGIGAALSDLIYAAIAFLGIHFIDSFLKKQTHFIQLFIGILLITIGLAIFFSSFKEKNEKEDDFLHPALSTFFIGLSNPMTLFIFLALFSWFGVKVHEEEIFFNVLFVIAIFFGACLFWYGVTKLINQFRKKLTMKNFIVINQMIGIFIFLFGLYHLICGLV